MSGTSERARVLKEEILERVRELASDRLGGASAFVPGETPIRYAGRVYDEKEMVNLVEASLEFWLTAGRWHARLEAGLASWYGVSHARLVNSGSSANLLAVAALMSPLLGARRLRAGDEVLTVAAGFPTTVAPILQLGLVPVFVDVTLPGANADPLQLAAAVTPRTRAVMLAHTLGNPFAVAEVKSLCEQHGLFLIEDNCDAAGSLYGGRKTAGFGDLATLSFYPPHHMTTGEGGAVLTSDATLLRAVESLRDWGRDCWCASGVDNTCRKRFDWKLGDLPHGYDHKYTYGHLGFNLKMTDLQAAVGVAQLEKLDAFCKARRDNWSFLRRALDDCGDSLSLPEPTPGSDPSWFGFLITVKEGAPASRDDVVRELERRKIQTRMLFAGNLVRQPALASLTEDARAEGRPAPFRVAAELTNTDTIMKNSFWVGTYPGLGPREREYVAESLREAVRGYRRPSPAGTKGHG